MTPMGLYLIMAGEIVHGHDGTEFSPLGIK